MLALDQAYDNQRIKASVLQNLGQLHFSVGNYSMATNFFAKRTSLPFLNKHNEALFRWHFARSLFYYNNYINAAKEGEIALKLAQEAEMKESLVAFREKTAFYNIYATHYHRAVTLYQKVLKDESLKGINRAKVLLGYGYSLLKLQKTSDATKVFQELITLTSKLKTVPADSGRRISFEPKRLQLIAYGFLASSCNNPKEKVEYLSQRIKILTSIDDRIKDFAYDEKSRLEFLIKALQQKVIAYEQSELLQQMQITMSEALKLLPIYLTQGGGYNSQVVIRTLNNYISLALLYPKEFKNREPIELESLVNKTIKALTLTGYTPPITSKERFKLQLLKTAYDVQITGKKTKKQLKELISDLKKDPAWLEELEELIL
jgi:tetratricopeptide (TPR) repeat protein